MNKWLLTIIFSLFAFNVNAAEWNKESSEDLLTGKSSSQSYSYADEMSYKYLGRTAVIVDRGTSLYVSFGPYMGNRAKQFSRPLTFKIDGVLYQTVKYSLSTKGTALFVNDVTVREAIRNAKVVIAQGTDFRGSKYTAKWTFN